MPVYTAMITSLNFENVYSISATIGGGFFVGVLIGYALKKVVKLVAVVVGLFFAGLTYLQFSQTRYKLE